MSRRKWNRVIAVAMAVMMMVSMLLPMSGTAGRGDNYEAEATSAISPGSRYTVDFAYEGYEFSMGGNQSILLSELFFFTFAMPCLIDDLRKFQSVVFLMNLVKMLTKSKIQHGYRP